VENSKEGNSGDCIRDCGKFGKYVSDNGSCSCINGYERLGGMCEKICKPGHYKDENMRCKRCIYLQDDICMKECPDGYV